MNNSWTNEQYQMQNMMSMPHMMQNMMPPLMPPMCMMGEMNMAGPPAQVDTPVGGPMPGPVGPQMGGPMGPQMGGPMGPQMGGPMGPQIGGPMGPQMGGHGPMNAPMGHPRPNGAPLIGPVIPDNLKAEDMNIVEDGESENQKDNQGGKGRDRREQSDRHRDRSTRGPSSRERFDRNDRSDRSRGDRDRNRSDRSDRNDRNDRSRSDRRERRSKWDSNDDNPGMPGQLELGGNMMLPGMNMAAYGNMNNMMGHQQMEMANMQNTMQNSNPMMPGINMMPNMIGNVMDGNMMMMNQPMVPMANQAIFLSKVVLLPPSPGTNLPNRREKPPGCRTVFVGGLPSEIGEDTIEEIFQRFGQINNVKLHRQGVCHVRFEKEESVEQAFFLSGYRFKGHDQMENEATTIFIDYALNREDQNEFEKKQRNRQPTPPRIEPYSPASLNAISEKIKSDEQFSEAASVLAAWLERGECNKRNANIFYSLVQASNNQMRRLYNEKMTLDEEFQNMKTSIRDKFASVVNQFEQVAKILTAAKHQRVSDHFTKHQRRNIDMWIKMTEELENIKEEFNAIFDEEESDKIGKNTVMAEKYEALKNAHDNLMYELEGYKNEAHLAKNEAERKFEKFKAQFIAQQALQTGNQVFPPLPPPPLPNLMTGPSSNSKPQPPPPTPDDGKICTSGPSVPPSEAKLISILTAFLMVHPLGASLDYLVSYVRSMAPNVTQATVQNILMKYGDVFCRNTSGVGASMEHRWGFVTFDIIKNEA